MSGRCFSLCQLSSSAPIVVIVTPPCILLGKIAHSGSIRGTRFVIAVNIFIPAADATDKESTSSLSHHPASSLARSPSWGVSYCCRRHCQRETHSHHLLVIAVASSHVLFGVIALPVSIGSHHVIIAIGVLVAASAAAAKEGCIVIVIVITGSPCILLRAVTLPGSVRWPRAHHNHSQCFCSSVVASAGEGRIVIVSLSVREVLAS